MLDLNDGRDELWQWDTGRTLIVDADCSQVHFSNKVFGRSIDVNVAYGVAIIPDVLLQTDNDLNVWAFSGTAENGYTKISKTFKVNRRNKPADYVFTPPDQTTLEQIQEKIDYLESIQDPDAIKNAVNDYLEQNPVEAPVQSVNGKTGAVKLNAIDVGAISQDNLQDATDKALAQAKASGEFDGADGADGGYYTPSVTQPDANTMRMSFSPSKEGMTAVSETYITLPSGGSGSVAIDSTLTVSGQAADAKAVGDALAKKQDKPDIRTALDDVAVAGAQYYLGEQTDVSVVLPADADVGQIVLVSWYNGDTAATLSITGTMLDFDFVPSANTRSEINALWDGRYWAVLGNEMAVPKEVKE